MQLIFALVEQCNRLYDVVFQFLRWKRIEWREYRYESSSASDLSIVLEVHQFMLWMWLVEIEWLSRLNQL